MVTSSPLQVPVQAVLHHLPIQPYSRTARTMVRSLLMTLTADSSGDTTVQHTHGRAVLPAVRSEYTTTVLRYMILIQKKRRSSTSAYSRKAWILFLRTSHTLSAPQIQVPARVRPSSASSSSETASQRTLWSIFLVFSRRQVLTRCSSLTCITADVSCLNTMKDGALQAITSATSAALVRQHGQRLPARLSSRWLRAAAGTSSPSRSTQEMLQHGPGTQLHRQTSRA